MAEPVTLCIDVRALRHKMNLSLEMLQQQIGIDKSTLARIENGKLPSLPHALKIAQFWHIPVEKIWRLKP